jgi:hypothetical protein
MHADDLIRYRLLNYLIEAHECQFISANVAVMSEIAESDWGQVQDVLTRLQMDGDIVMTKDNQPYRSGVNGGWFFHAGNFQIKATVRGRREYAKLQILKEPPVGEVDGQSPPEGAGSQQG